MKNSGRSDTVGCILYALKYCHIKPSVNLNNKLLIRSKINYNNDDVRITDQNVCVWSFVDIHLQYIVLIRSPVNSTYLYVFLYFVYLHTDRS